MIASYRIVVTGNLRMKNIFVSSTDIFDEYLSNETFQDRENHGPFFCFSLSSIQGLKRKPALPELWLRPQLN